MAKPRILLDADNYESDYGNINLQTASLQRGQNVVTVDKNTPFNVLNIDGRTLVNLLGRDGNCEDLSKWTAYVSSTVALDSSNQLYSANAIKFTVANSQTQGGIYKTDISSQLTANAYYVALADVKNGTTPNMYIQANAIRSSASTSTSYAPVYVAFQYTSGVFPLYIFSNATVGQYAWIDGVRVYQITQTEYNAIQASTYTTTQLAAKYPYVDDVKHMQNPYLIKYGQNLLPPIQEGWVFPNSPTFSNTIVGSYKVTGTTNASGILAQVNIPVLPNQTYTLSGLISGYVSSSLLPYLSIQWIDALGNSISYNDTSNTITSDNIVNVVTKTAPSNAASANILLASIGAGTFTWSNMIFNLGSTALTFTPQNNDYLFMTTTLASSVDGSVKDYAYYKDGLYYKSKKFVPDYVLDGSLGWVFQSSTTGYKNVKIPVGNFVSQTANAFAAKYDGKILTIDTTGVLSSSDKFTPYNDGYIYFTISSTDSGWGDSYTPTVGEIQAYFWGWKMYDNVTPTNSYSSGTKAWVKLSYMVNGSFTGVAGTDTTNTVPTTIANNGYKPYKLTYQLAQEQEELIQFEGDIQLSVGGNQVEYGEGVIIREKVNVNTNPTNANINQATDASKLTYRTSKILNVYKNGNKDTKWIHYAPSAYGNDMLYTPIANYDATAEYTVSYIYLDKYSLSSNVFSGNATYNTNLRNIVNQISQELTDVTTYADALGVRFQNYGIKGLGERIESGSSTITIASGNVNTRQDGNITFSRSFSKLPIVLLTITGWSGTNTFKIGYLGVSGVATTGMTYSLNVDTAQTYGVYWIAIGT